MMRKLFFLMFCSFAFTAAAQRVIDVSAEGGDMTQKIQAAIEQSRESRGKAVIIRLQNADYDISRQYSSPVLYYVSNTTSEEENPNQTKHVGLWLKNLKNVTIDGQGARLITHGEMTSFAIDGCENIRLCNFTITAADPTVPEMTVTETGKHHLTAQIHPQSQYKIEDGRFSFVGDGWTLSGGIAQSYDHQRDITWRSWSPLSGLQKAVELEPGLVRFTYKDSPQAQPGLTFQMRDGIRDEVCGLIQYSKDVTLDRLHFAFLGNFGIVGQMTENLTYSHLLFEPEAGSGRTCAGFADFIQMSGCKGKLLIENSRFSGAHDDPINIHGTHLTVMEYLTPSQLRVKYMHPQTFGFQSFLPGNQLEFINPHSLMPVASGKVKRAEMKNEREIVITLDKPVDAHIRRMEKLVIENVTYTPEVIIRENYFSRIPTRGILVTTRRKVLIEDNTFFRMQMSGILIADDARSWFESGMVRDVTIRGNHFIECGSPAIRISPENDRNEGFVHRNILITNNRFQILGGEAVSAKSVDGLKVINNFYMTPEPRPLNDLIHTSDCRQLLIQND